jgi:ribosomal-protein-alanine N-acetyltransferase
MAPLASMHGACFPDEPWDADALGRILGLAGAFGFLAWRDGEPAGFIIARDLGGEVEILTIGVLPESRRRGCARSLLDAVAGEGQRRGAGSLVLEVAEPNAAAQALYCRFGFTRVGRRPRYYRAKQGLLDALILRRAI